MMSRVLGTHLSNRLAHKSTEFFDVCVFFVLLRLVYSFQRQHRQTYQEDDDLHGIWWVVPPTVMLAVIFHPNLNRSGDAYGGCCVWLIPSS